MPANISNRSREDWNLDPMAVKRRAKSLPGVQLLTLPNANSATKESIVSCLVGLPVDNVGKGNLNMVEHLARVNIFCDTGTISTTRVVFQGQTRDLFRRNVTSLDVVERILRHPPALTAIDEKIVMNFTATEHNTDTSNSNEVALKADIELADVGLAILNGEKEKLEMHLEAIEDEVGASSDEEEEEEEVEEEEEEGMEFQFSLPAAAMQHVEQVSLYTTVHT